MDSHYIGSSNPLDPPPSTRPVRAKTWAEQGYTPRQCDQLLGLWSLVARLCKAESVFWRGKRPKYPIY